MGRNKCLEAIAFLLVLTLTPTFGQNAQPCVPANCSLPDCRCSGSDIPGGLAGNQIPQLVFLSFDAAVSRENFDFYQDVLSNRKNPNNQSITVTFYVTHSDTNYTMVHELWRNGHEIGLHSISANTSQAYWQSLNDTMWRKELIDQREQLNVFGKIPPVEVRGVRAPQLIVGGDAMLNVLNQARIKYDCSMPTEKYRTTGFWPYTNDYQSTQDCLIPSSTCPKQVHAGFWTVPMVNLVSSDGIPCSMIDQCEPLPKTANATFDLMNNNFQNHHKGHRAPFGVYLRHGWVNGTADPGDDQIEQRRIGFIRFLDYLDTLDDVYIVSVYRGLQWVQAPTPLSELANFAPFQVTPRASQCRSHFSCLYRQGQVPPPSTRERTFHSCASCPTVYPWVGNHLGRDPYIYE